MQIIQGKLGNSLESCERPERDDRFVTSSAAQPAPHNQREEVRGGMIFFLTAIMAILSVGILNWGLRTLAWIMRFPTSSEAIFFDSKTQL